MDFPANPFKMQVICITIQFNFQYHMSRSNGSMRSSESPYLSFRRSLQPANEKLHIPGATHMHLGLNLLNLYMLIISVDMPPFFIYKSFDDIEKRRKGYKSIIGFKPN